MDKRLLAWGRQPWPGRFRNGQGRRGGYRIPRLWLFTDLCRLPDPRAAVAALPPGAAGVVLRHDGAADRAVLARDLARICRDRRLLLVVAGDPRLAAAVGAGVHLRDGRWPKPRKVGAPQIAIGHGLGEPGGRARTRASRPRVITSSAHSVPALRRTARAGVDLVFLSPVFATGSHTGEPGLGPLRWARMARMAPPRLRVAALGGLSGRNVQRLPRKICAAVGAIAALSL